MTLNGWLQIALFIAAVLLLAKPMGKLYDGSLRTPAKPS